MEQGSCAKYNTVFLLFDVLQAHFVNHICIVKLLLFNDGVKTHRHLYHLSQITAIVESNNKLVVLVSSGVKTPEDTFCSY